MKLKPYKVSREENAIEVSIQKARGEKREMQLAVERFREITARVAREVAQIKGGGTCQL